MEEGSNLSKTTFQNPKWWPFLQDGCQINFKMIFYFEERHNQKLQKFNYPTSFKLKASDQKVN